MTILQGGPPSMQELALEISARANGRPIGAMQKRRARRIGLTQPPSLFDGRTIWDKYAYHVGGRTEFQFNIGYESFEGSQCTFRHGVAFSLERSQTVPDISIFRDRIQRFNEYIDVHPKSFDDFSMWYWIDGERRPNQAPAPIPDTLVRPGVFVVLGTTCPPNAIDIETVLDDFDRLMPLYEFVEARDKPLPRETREAREFEWTPGNSARVLRARFEREERNIERVLRHNELQAALFSHLGDIHGYEQVSGEQDCGIGKFVDVAVRDGEKYIYYEIKTGHSPQSCIREALGQLMEYSFWPGAQAACGLVVVGELPLDTEASDYLGRLREEFSLPLTYQQFDLDAKRFVS